MKVTITIEVSDQQRRAIAADNIDFKRLKVAPASKEDVKKWLEYSTRILLEGTEETYVQGGEK